MHTPCTPPLPSPMQYHLNMRNKGEDTGKGNSNLVPYSTTILYLHCRLHICIRAEQSRAEQRVMVIVARKIESVHHMLHSDTVRGLDRQYCTVLYVIGRLLCCCCYCYCSSRRCFNMIWYDMTWWMKEQYCTVSPVNSINAYHHCLSYCCFSSMILQCRIENTKKWSDLEKLAQYCFSLYHYIITIYIYTKNDKAISVMAFVSFHSVLLMRLWRIPTCDCRKHSIIDLT
jgi:hypothetical protein